MGVRLLGLERIQSKRIWEEVMGLIWADGVR